MKASGQLAEWQAFVVAHGWRAQCHELAAVVGQSEEVIQRFRSSGACSRLAASKGFDELFSIWHGRVPTEDDWPPPRKSGANGTYEWQTPEIALLASLVGQISQDDIADVLTARLREKTGDQEAERSRNAVQLRMNKIGLQTTDVVGGLTTAAAAREIGSLAIVNQMIQKRELPAKRVGRLWVIPYDAWSAWKAKRVFPPEGYVQLSTIREVLAIRSDKLSEFARMELIPTAVRCNPYGTKGPSSKFGTWWISKEVAEQLVADRRAGRKMPWHGKYADNLRTTFKLWEKRKHPAACKTCADIWGEQGVPTTFEDYAARYPTIAHGAKRHLTRPWSPGITIEEVAEQAGRSIEVVRLAIKNGVLASTVDDGGEYVSRTDATRWCARKCPDGESEKSWISLKVASDTYFFAIDELRAFIGAGTLTLKIGAVGTSRGIEYVSRHQCGQLREKIGFTEEEAARRLGLTVAHFQHLLEGVDWRKAEKIPLITVQAVRKRMESRNGYSVEEAAARVGKTEQWVRERIEDGTIRISSMPWDQRILYITKPMLKRLQAAAAADSAKPEKLGAEWLTLNDAAMDAGVSMATLNEWGNKGELAYREAKRKRHYHVEAVRARARKYWQSVRFHRAVPPAWLQSELAA